MTSEGNLSSEITYVLLQGYQCFEHKVRAGKSIRQAQEEFEWEEKRRRKVWLCQWGVSEDDCREGEKTGEGNNKDL